ncbi:hypothetical protein [Parvibaculum sp.]|uniref:hypothetical protein n=1 Tax=Parvibaculum sp. TaxID=2024848 RepID=UPI0032116AA2
MSVLRRRFIKDYVAGDEIKVRLCQLRRVERLFDAVEHSLSVKEPGAAAFANATVQGMRRDSGRVLKRFTQIAARGFENKRGGALSGEKFKLRPLTAGSLEAFARSAYDETWSLAKSLSGADIEVAKALAEASKAPLYRSAAGAASVALWPAMVMVPSKEELRASEKRRRRSRSSRPASSSTCSPRK